MEKISLDFDFWRFCLDWDDMGIDQQWELQDNQPYLDEKSRICVPSCWDRKTAGELADYKGVAWFWRVFKLPETCSDKKYFLKIDRMIHSVKVYVDGEVVGDFDGGFLPCKFDISHLSVDEEHFLAIRLDAREEINRYILPKVEENSLFGGTQKYRGIFGSVSVVTEEFLVLDDLKLETKVVYETPDSVNYAELSFSLYLKNNSDIEYNGKIQINISRDYVDVSEEIRDVNVLAGNSRLSKIVFNVDLENEDVWSPDNPAFFNIGIKVGNDECTQINVQEIMGMRQIEYKDGFIYLNGKKFEGKGAIFPIDHPNFGYALPSIVIADKLNLLKTQGYSIIRPNQGTFSPLIIEMASRIGFLVIEDIPLVELNNVEINTFFKDYVQSVTLQPSLVIWSIPPPFIEMSNSDPKLQKIIQDLDNLFNGKMDVSRFFVYKGDLGIKEWNKIQNPSLE